MTADKSFFQSLAGGVADFFEHLVDLLANSTTRTALIKDLGGTPDTTTAPPVMPTAQIDAIRAYQLKETTSAAEDAALAHDIVVALDALVAHLDVLAPAFTEDDFDGGEFVEQLTYSILEVAGSNWVRDKYPRRFFLLQAFQVIEDLGSTYGPGIGSFTRIIDSFAALFRFFFEPGRTLADLPGGEGRDDWTRWGDLTLRVLTAAFGIAVGLGKIELDAEIYHGWDAKGLDVDSDDAPTTADVIANRMGSIAVRSVPDVPSTAPSTTGQAQISFSVVPEELLGGTAAMMIALGGDLEVTSPIDERWTMSVKVRSDAGVAMLLGGPAPHFQIVGPTPNAPETLDARVGVVSEPDEGSAVSFGIPRRVGTRLEIGQLAAALEMNAAGVELTGSLINSALVVDSADSDGLIRELLAGVPLRLPFNLTVGVSSSRGFVLEGSMAAPTTQNGGVQNSPLGTSGSGASPVINATIPLGRKFGPVTVHEVALRIDKGSADQPGDGAPRVAVSADVSFSAQLGPMYLRLDRLGLGLVLDQSKPRSARNLRVVDADLSAKLPQGITVSIDSDLITGGGLLISGPAEGSYAGSLVLKLGNGLTLNATGIITTKYPDGTEGTSMIVIGTVEGLTWMIGPLRVEGLGILIGINRAVDTDAIRAGLPTGQLKHVLFPEDPIHHTTEVVAALRTFFPAKRRSHLIGILAKLSYLKPAILTIDAALICAWGENDNTRLIILGRMSSILPEGVGLLRLNLDVLGVVDLSAGTVAVDAVLVDSKLCDRFALTGAAALRGDDTVSGFALAVGGLHPRYRAPAGFPVLPRITLALTTGDNPSLVCQAYVAITANTLQFGANARLYAAACGFSLEGQVGFDVLIQLLPFHYLAEFRASVQLKRGSTNLFKVSVSGALEGPIPLRVAGKATFEILWWDYSVSFDKTLIGGSTPNTVPTTNVLEQVLGTLGDRGSWEAVAPGPTAQLVSVRTDPDAGVLAHPAGTLTVRQRVAPLNLSRDIDRLGEAIPAGTRRFEVTSVTLGGRDQTRTPTRDLFPPAQFFDMTDDEKLAAPSFEEMDSGVRFGTTAYLFDLSQAQPSPFDYTDLVVGSDGTPDVQPDPAPMSGPLVLTAVLLSAAATAPVRSTLSARFAEPVTDDAPRVQPSTWAAVVSEAPAAAPTTWVEAKADAGPRGVVVPSFELAGT